MEKVLQEFRIIETDEGFRIEIKGDKEQLREFVMNLDPRKWMSQGFGPFGRPWMWRGSRGRQRGPFGRGPWAAWEGDDPADGGMRRGKGKRRGHGHGHGHGSHGHHHHHEHGHGHGHHHQDHPDHGHEHTDADTAPDVV